MKNLITIFILIINFNLSINCQYWAPKGTTWYYEQDDFVEPIYSFIRFKSIGDTLIKGDTAIILEESRVYIDTFTKHIYMKYDSNRVFYYHAPDDEFKLLYDFNAVQGDTVKAFCRESEFFIEPTESAEPSVIIKIDSVSTMIIGGETLKVQYFTDLGLCCCCSMKPKRKIIERIGHVRFMFPQHAWADPPYGGPLRCYEDSIIGLYKISDIDCDYISTKVDNQKIDSNIFITPNPAKDKIFINTKIDVEYIQIFNLQGILIFEQDNKTEIDISDLPNGIHLIKIFLRNKEFITRKMIKYDY
jgi:hypothetical protein